MKKQDDSGSKNCFRRSTRLHSINEGIFTREIHNKVTKIHATTKVRGRANKEKKVLYIIKLRIFFRYIQIFFINYKWSFSILKLAVHLFYFKSLINVDTEICGCSKYGRHTALIVTKYGFIWIHHFCHIHHHSSFSLIFDAFQNHP